MAKMIPDGARGWAVFETNGRRVTELFQSRSLAEKFSEEGQIVRYGYVEPGTTSFVDPEMDKQK
jgi:hypothetical protein